MATIVPGLFRIASMKRGSEEGKNDFTDRDLRGLPLDEEYSAVPHFRNFPEGRWWHSRRRLGAIIAQISRDFRRRDSATTGASVNTFVCGNAGKILAGTVFLSSAFRGHGTRQMGNALNRSRDDEGPAGPMLSRKDARSLLLSLSRRPINSGVTILMPNNPFTAPIVAARRDADPPMYFYRIALRALENQDRQIDPVPGRYLTRDLRSGIEIGPISITPISLQLREDFRFSNVYLQA